MSIANGQRANATNLNNAFPSRTADTSMTGIVSLENSNSPTIDDVQQAINDNADALLSKADQSAVEAGDLATLANANVYTDQAIATLVGTAPGTLDTLGEISDALNDDANLAATLTAAIGANTTAIAALGAESTFTIANNQAAPADATGLLIPGGKSGVVVDYQVKRVTTSTGAVELLETGTMLLTKLSSSSRITIQSSDDDAGVTFTITAAGQVQYTSTNITGTPSVSKLTFKARSLTA